LEVWYYGFQTGRGLARSEPAANQPSEQAGYETGAGH
jgi:hypothetical protein